MRNRIGAGTLALALGSALFAGVAAARDDASSASPSALEFGRVRLSTGPTLHYAAQGPADGPVMIMLHGYSDSWYSFSPLLPLLPAGWRVYALSQRGHGDSDRPLGDYSPPTLARDAIAFMDAMGVQRATVVGHSLGSIVAQHVVSLAPERVDRLVLIGGIGSGQAMNGMHEFRAAVHELTDPVPVAFSLDFQVSTIYVPQREIFLDSVVAEGSKLPAHVWKAVADGMAGTGPATNLETSGVPTLALWGDRDTYMPFEEQRVLVDRLRARLIVYPRIGHAVHWEAPAQVAEDLIDFMDDGRWTIDDRR